MFKQAGDVWQLYELEGTGRAAFPLDKKTDDETSAAGMALDLTSQEQVLISKCLFVCLFVLNRNLN